MDIGIIVTSTVQITGDLTCVGLSAYLLYTAKNHNNFKLFYSLILLSFSVLAFGDIYYNYMFRIMRYNIRHSTGLFVTLSFVTFQISQLYNWLFFVRKQKVPVFSQQNIPYLLSTALVIYILVYFFSSNQNYPTYTVIIQTLGVMIDMAIWLFAIVCLANTTSTSITSLSLGCLLIISADLTTRCLYIFEPQELASTRWVHIVWAFGVWVTAFGLIKCIKKRDFTFAPKDSLLVNSNSQMVLTAFIAFLLGVIFLTLFKLNSTDIDMHAILWSIPIVLIFTLSLSIMLAKKFSSMITQPLDDILERINLFDSGKTPQDDMKPSRIHEFNLLGNFISASFKKLSAQLEREVKIAAQVSHDISSPLSSLDILVRMSSGLEDDNRILLRNAVNDIRSIVDNLQKDTSKEVKPTQLIVLVGYSISQANMLIRNANIKIEQDVSMNAYHYFVNVSSSVMKSILTNIINNAIEAISTGNGIITISVSQDSDNSVKLVIGDNGPGIPDNIKDRLFDRGFTTKEKGSGLGLFSAKENITEWGGTVSISSDGSNGTEVIMELPVAKPPSWFTTELIIKENSNVICVDDSLSVKDAWQVRLKSMNVKLLSCQNKEELLKMLDNELSIHSIFLVDYEFAGQNYTGKDLIKIIMAYGFKPQQIHMVTSRSDEIDIQNYCVRNNIYIIPKIYIPKMPIKIN